MKEKIAITFIAVFMTLAFTSCRSSREILTPVATNTVKAVSLDEMNLTSKDYDVLNRIEATASVILTLGRDWYTISDPDGMYRLEYEYSDDKVKGGKYVLEDMSGVIRAGYLARDYGSLDLRAPDDIARRVAIYRLINLVKEQGGDGIIEPVISTNVEETERNKIVYQTTVSGKVIRLKSTK